MKIAIVCYGHVDATLGLAKYLSQLDDKISVDFIFLQCQSKSSTKDNGSENFAVGLVDVANLKNGERGSIPLHRYINQISNLIR